MRTEQLRIEEEVGNIGYWERVLENPTSAYAELFRRERDFLLQNIEVNDAVLDLGCGDGRNIRTLLERTTNVVGLDNDVRAIRDARIRFGQNSSPKFVCGDMTRIPFDEETFDKVTLLMALVNLVDGKINALREVNRVLKQEGVLLLSVFAETAFEERMKIYRQVNVLIDGVDEHGKVTMENGKIVSEQFSLEEMSTMLAESGFTIDTHEKVGDLAYCIRAAKI